MPLSEEMRRLRGKLIELQERGRVSVSVGTLVSLLDEVERDMHAANPGPEPYDLSASAVLGRRRSGKRV